jgi:AcrR family transcriptional regulator
MGSPRRPGGAINTALRPGRKSTQRERLIAGMTAAANESGYAGANVSAVIAAAGVSRPTFYEYFSDRDDCFHAALADAHGSLLEVVGEAVAGAPRERALHATAAGLVGFAAAEPAAARLLTGESLAGGRSAQQLRDRQIAELERLVERRYRGVAAEASVPDVSARAMLGGLYRLLAARLRRGEPCSAALAGELSAWLDGYARPLREHRWRVLKPGAPPPASPFVPVEPLRAPRPLGPGRPRVSPEQVVENQRLRVMFAAAQLAERKGYLASTVADVLTLSKVDGHAFYALFKDKQDAFMAMHELGVQQVLAVTAEAFFSGKDWPARVWEGARAFTQFLERNPLIAHVGFVEAYAVGPGAVQRVEDSHTSFGVFLQEGYHRATSSSPPSRAALEAIVTTAFEIVYRQARGRREPQLAGMLGHTVFLCLAPFLGTQRAEEAIAEGG